MSRRERQRLATWILTRCAFDYRRDSFIGDLIEQYEERGGWWYWRQALGALRTHSATLLVTAAETGPTAEVIGDLILGIALVGYGCIQLGIYANLFIGWTPMRSDLSSLIVVSTMIGAALIGAAVTLHKIRLRAASAT